MGMKPKVFRPIPEGRHLGTVTEVEQRTEPYEYTDVKVMLEDVGQPVVKYGVPTSFSFQDDGKPNSKLAKLAVAFGYDFASGKEWEPTSLVGERVVLMTINETKAEGTFARVVDNSLRKRVD